MLNPDDFKLLNMLSGLYYARDTINAEIEKIEAKFQPSTLKKIKIPKRVKEKKNQAQKSSEFMKKFWASNSPEAQARRKKMILAANKKRAALRKEGSAA